MASGGMGCSGDVGDTRAPEWGGQGRLRIARLEVGSIASVPEPDPSRRRSHRLALRVDGDVLHPGTVAALARILSAGLGCVGYFLHVLWVARRAPCLPARGECLLVSGKHAPRERIDRDFQARIDRTAACWRG